MNSRVKDKRDFSMVMKSLRDGASGGVTKFILMGFMALAVGGLVLTDVGGFFRGGVGGSDVARVGDQAISIQQFDSTLRRTLQPIGMSTQDAYQFGYVQQVLSGEIRSALLQQAAKSYGVQVSDARALMTTGISRSLTYFPWKRTLTGSKHAKRHFPRAPSTCVVDCGLSVDSVTSISRPLSTQG